VGTGISGSDMKSPYDRHSAAKVHGADLRNAKMIVDFRFIGSFADSVPETH
jgi:hypothetical protein